MTPDGSGVLCHRRQEDDEEDELHVQPVVVHEAAMICDSVSSL
ncbi:MAG TPA: hypothetical protein VGD48_02745 [Kutzneria sp.]|jgi:hypothetical protein